MNISGTQIADAKARLRKRALNRRKALFARYAEQAPAMAAGHGAAVFAGWRKGVVAGYYPVNTEISPLPLLADLDRAGWKTALPVVADGDAPLVFAAWREGDDLDCGAYSIPCPAAAAPRLVPDIVIVPLLAFDCEGRRLGYGGGYYDRTLQYLRGRGRCVAIGLAFAGQMVDEVPRDAFDQGLDNVLSEEGLML